VETLSGESVDIELGSSFSILSGMYLSLEWGRDK